MCNEVCEHCKEIASTLKDNVEIFKNAILYERAFSAKYFFYYLMIDDLSESSFSFVRRMIEADIINFFHQAKQLESINYQVFKLKALNVNVGLKESFKIKDKLKLSKKTDFYQAFLNNDFLYMHGTTPTEFVPSQMLGYVYDLLSKSEDFPDSFKARFRIYKIIYDPISIFIHQGSSFTVTNSLTQNQDFLKNFIDNLSGIIKESFGQEFDKYKKLSKIDLHNVINSQKIKELDEKITNELSLIFLRTMYKYAFPLQEAIVLLNNYLSSSLKLFTGHDYIPIIMTFKSKIEKMSIFNTYFDTIETTEDIVDYSYKIASEISFSNAIKLDKSNKNDYLDKDVKRLYENARIRYKIPFDEFKQKIIENPSYVLTREKCSFTQSVNNFLHSFDNEKNEKIASLYRLSISLGHSNGFLLYKNDDYYTYAKEIILFTIEFLIETILQIHKLPTSSINELRLNAEAAEEAISNLYFLKQLIYDYKE